MLMFITALVFIFYRGINYYTSSNPNNKNDGKNYT